MFSSKIKNYHCHTLYNYAEKATNGKVVMTYTTSHHEITVPVITVGTLSMRFVISLENLLNKHTI